MKVHEVFAFLSCNVVRLRLLAQAALLLSQEITFCLNEEISAVCVRVYVHVCM